MEPYPLLTSPYYRHGEQTPWGGATLRELYGKAIPDERTGESLEISALPGMASGVMNGPLAGRTLEFAHRAWGADLTGAEGGFPLLIKLLCSREPLSVQVHPDDGYAATHEGKRGKAEAWRILSAEPGSRIVYGLTEGAGAGALSSGRGGIEGALRWVEVAEGDVYPLPPGLIHALGGGIVAYEAQQASDVTYRIWDWDRRGADGKPRELHLAKAAAVARPELRPNAAQGAARIEEGMTRTVFLSNEYFVYSELELRGKAKLPDGRLRLLTALSPATLTWDDGTVALGRGRSCAIPASLKGVRIEGAGIVLLSMPAKAASTGRGGE